MRILTVFGTRPEAIKLAPVVLELNKHRDIRSFVCVTGQHRHMLDQVLKMFRIRPDFDLDVMKKDQSLEDIISAVLHRIGPVFDKTRPDIVLVQGDTTSAFIVALAAFFRKVRIGHVEAGLRSYDKYKPYPEEVNRRLLTHVADYHFCPTEASAKNLLKENIEKHTVFVTGNTVIDALLEIANRKPQSAKRKARSGVESGSALCSMRYAGVSIDPRMKIILVTAHRRESFGRDMDEMFRAIREIAVSRPEVEIIYPVHLNPNVRRSVDKILKGAPRVHLVEPMEYEPFVRLMKKAHILLTDSGGIQEEAPALDKPVLVMRHVTERPEGVKAGCAKLVGTRKSDIVKNVYKLLDDPKVYRRMAKAKNPYGAGDAARKIVGILKRELR